MIISQKVEMLDLIQSWDELRFLHNPLFRLALLAPGRSSTPPGDCSHDASKVAVYPTVRFP
jgi:hypothetical protein